MRVLKAGASTGVTEGKITRINGEEITLKPLDDFPLDYQLSDTGDSGAIWVRARIPFAGRTALFRSKRRRGRGICDSHAHGIAGAQS